MSSPCKDNRITWMNSEPGLLSNILEVAADFDSSRWDPELM